MRAGRRVGLCAKWCPSLYHSFDRRTLICESIARWLFPPTHEQPLAFLPAWPQQLHRWNPPAGHRAASMSAAVGLVVRPVARTFSGFRRWRNCSNCLASCTVSSVVFLLPVPASPNVASVRRGGDSGTGWSKPLVGLPVGGARAVGTLRGQEPPEEARGEATAALHDIGVCMIFVRSELGHLA